MKQQTLVFRTWGGARVDAGRPKVRRSRVEHRLRPRHRLAHPVHVTMRAHGGLPPFRERAVFAEMREAFRKANRSPAVGSAFRVVEFSVQTDHVHVIVEAQDRDILTRGLQGLAIRLARAVNRALSAKGSVWRDRYHARELKTPREVRNALVYVLMNARKHGARIASGIDAFSSAPWFAGFAERVVVSLEPRPVALARTWLCGLGWRRRGLVALSERPRAPS